MLDEINSDYDVMIRYRVTSEKKLAGQLFDELSQLF
jgi:hypothetical protein